MTQQTVVERDFNSNLSFSQPLTEEQQAIIEYIIKSSPKFKDSDKEKYIINLKEIKNEGITKLPYTKALRKGIMDLFDVRVSYTDGKIINKFSLFLEAMIVDGVAEVSISNELSEILGREY